MPQESIPIIFLGGRFVIAMQVLGKTTRCNNIAAPHCLFPLLYVFQYSLLKKQLYFFRLLWLISRPILINDTAIAKSKRGIVLEVPLMIAMMLNTKEAIATTIPKIIKNTSMKTPPFAQKSDSRWASVPNGYLCHH